MANFRPIEMRLLDELFGMPSGYVLDFSNRTFAEFFHEELAIDIDDPKFALEGGSKGKRLRFFLQNAEPPLAARTLNRLWEYRIDHLRRSGGTEEVREARERFLAVVQRISGGPVKEGDAPKRAAPQMGPAAFEALGADLLRVSRLQPQPRGYAFEKFLTQLFIANGLQPHDAFRLQGEQIDGSFQFSGQTYLLEAKWQNLPVGVADLHGFQGKIDQKAAWTRGLFISNSGFSHDGISAFGRRKSVVCMEGLDLADSLSRKIPFVEILERKVRRAAETGLPFARVRDLFP